MSEHMLKQTTKNMYFLYLYHFFLDGTRTCSELQYSADRLFKNPVANQGKTYLSGATGRLQSNHISLYQMLKKLHLGHIEEEVQICCHIHFQRMTTDQNFLWNRGKILGNSYWENNFQLLYNCIVVPCHSQYLTLYITSYIVQMWSFKEKLVCYASKGCGLFFAWFSTAELLMQTLQEKHLMHKALFPSLASISGLSECPWQGF